LTVPLRLRGRAAILPSPRQNGGRWQSLGDPAHFGRFVLFWQSVQRDHQYHDGGSSDWGSEQRLAYPLQVKPEMCSLNMGSMNFSIHPVAERIHELAL